MTYIFGFDKLARAGFIPAGSNLLLIGPPTGGKDFFLRRLFYNNVTKDTAGILVTTNEIGENVLDWFDAKGLPMDLDRFGVIDCVARTLDLKEYPKDYDVLKRVASPHDVDGVNARMSEYWTKFNTGGIREVVVAIETLTSLVARAPIVDVLRFLYALISKIKTTGAVGIYSVDAGMLDLATMNTLKNLTQGMIEMKDEGGKRYIRITGRPVTTDWIEYSLEGNDIKL